MSILCDNAYKINSDFESSSTVVDHEVKVLDFNALVLEGSPLTVSDLELLIAQQASTHHAMSKNDPGKLKRLIQSEKLQGHVFYTAAHGAIAYAATMPQIAVSHKDRNSWQKILYIEDFFVVSPYRGHGVFRMLMHHLAKEALKSDIEEIQWVTDARNNIVHNSVKHYGAVEADFIPFDATELMGLDRDGDYFVRPIKPNDGRYLERLGSSLQILDKTGTLDFRGYLVFEGKNDQHALAYVPGTKHVSTFKKEMGLYLEEPVFAKSILQNTDVKEKVITSVAIKAKQGHHHLVWHAGAESEAGVVNILGNNLELSPLCMLDGNPASRLLPYRLNNGKLKALANRDDVYYNIRIANNQPIGDSIAWRPPENNDGLSKFKF